MKKREQALVEVERKLQVASRVAFLVQRDALVRAEEARKFREELENAGERL